MQNHQSARSLNVSGMFGGGHIRFTVKAYFGSNVYLVKMLILRNLEMD